MTPPACVPAVDALLHLAFETRPDIDPERLSGAILNARTVGMPWPRVLTETAGMLARGEDHHDLNACVDSWRKSHPQGART